MTTCRELAPRLQLLTNGRTHVMVTRAGAGFSRWNGMAVTRWRADATRDGLGWFCYLRHAAGGPAWSATAQPTGPQDDVVDATFAPGLARLRRRHVGSLDGVAFDTESVTDIAVSPEDDVELRRVSLTCRNTGHETGHDPGHEMWHDTRQDTNLANAATTLTLTSYAEIVLEAPAADAAHPAFEKLFVQTEILPQWQAIVCMRRSRAPAEPTPWMFHLLLPSASVGAPVSYETDRMRFIGRGRSTLDPQALDTDAALSGTAGAVLDPVAAIRCHVSLAVGQTVAVDFISGVAASREACLALIQRCRAAGYADRLLAAAAAAARALLADLRCTRAEAALFSDLAASILYADAALRAPAHVLAQNRQGPSGLWRFSISGDLPIVLLGIDATAHIDSVLWLVRAHDHWQRHGVVSDLVVLVAAGAPHAPNLRAAVMETLESLGHGTAIGTPREAGGIFVLDADAVGDDGKVLLQSLARVVLDAADGPLDVQLEQRRA